MNTKIEFVAELPAELIAALGLCEETALRSWFENGALHVCVEEEPLDFDEVFSEGFGNGHTVGYQEGLAEGYERGYLDGIGSRPDCSDKAAASREGGRRS